MRNNKQNEINFFASSNQEPNPAFSKILSDHSYQSSCFKILDNEKDLIHNGVINVGTWNLMNKCFSKKTDEQRKNERNGTNLQEIEKQIENKKKFIDRQIKKLGANHPEIQRAENEIKKLQEKSKIKVEVITNNPFNIDETIEQYRKRKMDQMIKIIDNISSKNADDIICLQEVDFLTTKPSKIFNILTKEYHGELLTTAEQEQLKNSKPFELQQAKLYKCQLDLRETFTRWLKGENYSIITTNDIPADQNGTEQQRFATIYNNKKFTFKEGCGALPTEATNPSEKRQYRGFEIYLHDKNLDKDICITNIHLTFGKDYNEDIKAYQNSMQEKGIFHVMAGDTNNLQCIQYKTALGKWDDATNFEGKFDKHDRVIGATTLHKDTEKHKAYDRFFVVAPKNHYVTIVSNNDRNMKFVVSENSGKIRLKNTDSEHVAITGLGTPYKRGVDELSELYQEILKYKVNSNAYYMVLDDMVEVIDRKAISQKIIKKIISDGDIYDSLLDRFQETFGMKRNNNNNNY